MTEPAYLLVRPVPGVVPNSRRVVHLVPAPNPYGEIPRRLAALCGASFVPGIVDRLDTIRGMPCETCLARTPR
nr:hypothetical protein [Saccharomonospora viridis]